MCCKLFMTCFKQSHCCSPRIPHDKNNVDVIAYYGIVKKLDEKKIII